MTSLTTSDDFNSIPSSRMMAHPSHGPPDGAPTGPATWTPVSHHTFYSPYLHPSPTSSDSSSTPVPPPHPYLDPYGYEAWTYGTSGHSMAGPFGTRTPSETIVHHHHHPHHPHHNLFNPHPPLYIDSPPLSTSPPHHHHVLPPPPPNGHHLSCNPASIAPSNGSVSPPSSAVLEGHPEVHIKTSSSPIPYESMSSDKKGHDVITGDLHGMTGGSNMSSSPSGGHGSVKSNNAKTRTRDKYRVVYSDHQRFELEKEFVFSNYITIRRKSELAVQLGLSERQVKIWFQNRRAKDRKIKKKKEEINRRVDGGVANGKTNHDLRHHHGDIIMTTSSCSMTPTTPTTTHPPSGAPNNGYFYTYMYTP